MPVSGNARAADSSAGMSPSSRSALRSASHLLLVAEHEGEQPAEVVQVLAGVVQIDDLGGFGEMLRWPGSRSYSGAAVIPVTHLVTLRTMPDRAKHGGIVSAVTAL